MYIKFSRYHHELTVFVNEMICQFPMIVLHLSFLSFLPGAVLIPGRAHPGRAP